jgi:Coenzyme Q (ubiquinone) biosynthesis protein Coq4
MRTGDMKALFATEIARVPEIAEVRQLAGSARRWGGFAPRRVRVKIAARLAHAAFLAPDRVGAVWDALAEGWTGKPVSAPPIAGLGAAALPAPEDLWAAYWAVAEDAVAGKLDALAITERTAALGGLMPAAYLARTAAAAAAYPGIARLSGAALPARIELATLAACPHGSLGRQFHDLIVANAFDLEVLDRDAIGLSNLPTPLDYLNTRILQSHDLWHVVAGYETTALHEIALSAFQMAQFGHAYSAQFLAVTAAIGALGQGFGFPVLMTTVVSAYVHGRQAPPLMAIDWEREWNRSAEDIRAAYGIRPYDRPYKADLIETRLAA